MGGGRLPQLLLELQAPLLLGAQLRGSRPGDLAQGVGMQQVAPGYLAIQRPALLRQALAKTPAIGKPTSAEQGRRK